MQDITVAIAFVDQALVGARQAGYDVNAALKSCGISPALLQRPLARVHLDSFVALIQNLMHLMDDELLGLRTHPQRVGSFALVARSALHENNLVSALVCYVRSVNLLENGLVMSYEMPEDKIIVSLRRRPGSQVRSLYLIESMLMTFHRFLCWLGSVRIPLLRVELDYAAPHWAAEYRYLFFGAPVQFDREEIRLHLHRDDLKAEVQRDVVALQAYIRRAPRDMFTPLASSRASDKARRIILNHFEQKAGMPTAATVAQSLGLSEQTFWRRLRDEGLDFTELRTRVRRDIAIALLSRSTQSIENIAETIGYSESSAFIRAFKQWTGITPLAYRKL